MGCSSSNTLKNNSENNIENPQKENQNENNEETNSLKNLLKKPNLYTSFNFNKSLLSNSNLLLYTTYLLSAFLVVAVCCS